MRISQGVLALVLATSAPHVDAAALFSAPFLSFDTGDVPSSVAIGDLNGDDRPDLVLANNGSSSVSILHGNGDGSFGPKRDYPAGLYPISLAIGDLNGDDRPDIVVANQGSKTISVLLSNGDGSFGAKSDYASGDEPISVAIGDLDRDSRLDVAAVNRASNTVSVLLGDGNGGFRPKTDFGTGGSPSSVAIGDLNADGKLDVVAANYGWDGTVSILLGNGDGGFESTSDFNTGHFPQHVAIGDMNADGRPDLATANWTDEISVLLGSGNGTFGASSDYGAGVMPSSVAIGDLNGDGIMDLAVANSSLGLSSDSPAPNTVSVLLGQGNGNFGPSIDYGAGAQPVSVSIGDLNGDGALDLATANSGSNTVSVSLGNGDGTFGPRAVPTGSSPYSVAMDDLNGDGILDLTTSNVGANTVSVSLGNGDGTFLPKTDFVTGRIPTNVAIGDLNGDDKPDLVTANDGFNPETEVYGQTVSVLFGNGEGYFGANTDLQTAKGSNAVAVGDLNGDEEADLAVACFGASTASVLLGNGDGTFVPRTDFATGGGTDVAIADLNLDGNPDLVTSNGGILGPNTISVLLGNGDGTFQPKADYGTGYGPSSLAVGDLNGDKKPDLVAANSGSSSVSVLLGSGSGSFGSRTDFVSGPYPTSVAIGDLNGDGKLDLATANRASNTVSVLLGNGQGSFAAKTDFGTGDSPRSIAIGDLNGDGKPDLAAASTGQFPTYSSYVSVLLNTGNAVALVNVHVMWNRVELSWFGSSLAGMSATVYRKSSQTGWSAVASTTANGAGELRFEDVTVRPGEDYNYRLGVLQGGSETLYGETLVSVPGVTLALGNPRPNPTSDRFAVSLTMATVGRARLEVFDIAGRMIGSRDVAALGPGPHVVTFTEAALWSPGVYLVRLAQGPRSITTRVCIVR